MRDKPNLDACLARMPLIAILRGITPAEATDVAALLEEEGFSIVEVPMNSPQPLDSIRRIAEGFGARMVVGAGTVLSADEVAKVAAAGGRLIVSPNFDPEVVAATKSGGLYAAPGVFTASEGFAALKLGADCLKIFPAEAAPPKVIKALRAVLPKTVKLVPVGGISEVNMVDYWAAGANGFGIGSNLYKPGKSLAEIRDAARKLVAAARTFLDI